jgi:hypothetical protein
MTIDQLVLLLLVPQHKKIVLGTRSHQIMTKSLGTNKMLVYAREKSS